jgi:hypothetical protein
MAVFYNSIGTGGTLYSPVITLIPFSFSWKHTATGSQIGVVAAVSYWVYGSTIGQLTRTVKYGGVTMTSLGVQQWGTDSGWIEMFALSNAPKGTQTVTVDIRGGLALVTRLGRGNTVAYTGVDDFGTFSSAGNSSSSSMSVAGGSPVSAGISVGAFAAKEAGISVFNQNTRYQNNTHMSLAFGDVQGNGAAQTFTATRAGSGPWGGGSVVVNPADIVAVAKPVVATAKTSAQGKRYPRSPSFVRRSVFSVSSEK